GFGMPGQPRADFLVGRVWRVSPGVAHGGGPDTRLLPEASLRSPETAHGKNCLLQPSGEGGLQRMAVDVMGGWDDHRSRAPRQRLTRLRQCLLVNENLRAQGHVDYLKAGGRLTLG